MRLVIKIGASVSLAAGTMGCSTVPPLSHVTNNLPYGKDISVDDVVTRVKCELADSLRKRMTKDVPNFRWLENWTAKADLTLQVNESGGVTPNATFTQPLQNAFPVGSGPSNVLFSTAKPGATSTITATPQSFNFGLGAVYSGQVYRTETVSFALSLKELKKWREEGGGKDIDCLPVGGTDLQGSLDLESWINAALVPVESGNLELGEHPRPQQVGVVNPVGHAPAAPTLDDGRRGYYKDAAENAAKEATKSAQQAWQTERQAKQSKLLTSDIRHKIYEFAREAAMAAIYAKQASLNADADDAVENRAKQAIAADRNAEIAAKLAAIAKRAANPDPPIDSLAHSLNFIVTVGVSASPNWILLQWKGPANVGNLASYTGIRTHTLSIALGSPAPSGNAETNRVLNNEAFRQAIQSP
jgi:hypothetical protein